MVFVADGLGGYALLAVGTLKVEWFPNSPFMMGVYFILVATGSIAVYLCTIGTNIKNFDVKHRGKVTGALVSMYGLSAAFLSMLYNQLGYEDMPIYMFFGLLIVMCGLLPFVGAFTVQINTLRERKESKNDAGGVYGDLTFPSLFKNLDYYLIVYCGTILGGVCNVIRLILDRFSIYQ